MRLENDRSMNDKVPFTSKTKSRGKIQKIQQPCFVIIRCVCFETFEFEARNGQRNLILNLNLRRSMVNGILFFEFEF